jgi:hypothetical protein
MIAISILIGAFMIADAIMFVNGYRGYLFGATTDQEKSVRAKWFKDRGLEWSKKE